MSTLELFIGLRYLRAKKHSHFVSLIALIALLGIALAIILIITVLSVMNGFQHELRERILIMSSHITLSGLHGQGIQNWPVITKQIHTDNDITGSAPYIRGEAMLSHLDRTRATVLRGIDPQQESAVSAVAQKMKDGKLTNLRSGEFGIILGSELARTLNVRIGQQVTLISSQLNALPIGITPRFKRFTLVGIFEVGMHEFDSGLALIHIHDAAKLLRLKDRVSGIRLQIQDIFNAPRKRYDMAQRFAGRYWVSDWTQHHANFFKAIQMEKTAMFVILSLIIAVAAFNIVSTLVMVVMDKEGDIAILRTLGMSSTAIMRIFMIQGTAIGLLGVFLGATGGVALATHIESIVRFVESQLSIRFLDPSIYYISDLPSQVLWSDVALVCVIGFLASLLATLYPAWLAAKTEPATALRYE